MGSVKFSGGTRECYAVLHTILCVLFRGILVSVPLNAVFVLDCGLIAAHQYSVLKKLTGA